MSTQSTAVETTREERNVEFTPFGSQDKIKMNVAIVQKLIAVPTKSGKTCSEKEAIKFIMMCQAKRLNPFEGDAYLIGYDSQDGPTFSLITAHQTYLKRAEINPEFDGMKSGIIVQNKDNTITDIEGDFYVEGDQTVVGGWATVFFKNRKIPTTRRVRLKTFQKTFGVWRDNSAGMICKCAEADALRSSFPTMLGGLYMKEELVDIDVKTVITRPQFDGPQTGTTAETPTPRSQKGKKSTVEIVDTTGKDAPKEPTGEQEQNRDTGGEATPGKELPDLDHPYDELKKFSARDEVTEPQVVAWCKVNKNSHDVLLANAAPKTFMDLRTDTVKYLITNWADLLPLIKQVKV